MSATNRTRIIAQVLGGDVVGRTAVLAPGPGHSRADRSLSIQIDPAALEAFWCHSFAGDDWRECRDYVRRALGLTGLEGRRRRRVPYRPTRAAPVANDDPGGRTACALCLWNAGARFARNRRDKISRVARPHAPRRRRRRRDPVSPCFEFRGQPVWAQWLRSFATLASNEPCGIHRTFLDDTGRKLGRKMLGRARSAAIKLDADANVTLGLHLGEGLETCLAARLAGFRPVWALGSAGAIAAFPVLSGIEAITILGEVGDGGANLLEGPSLRCPMD